VASSFGDSQLVKVSMLASCGGSCDHMMDRVFLCAGSATCQNKSNFTIKCIICEG